MSEKLLANIERLTKIDKERGNIRHGLSLPISKNQVIYIGDDIRIALVPAKNKETNSRLYIHADKKYKITRPARALKERDDKATDDTGSTQTH